MCQVSLLAGRVLVACALYDEGLWPKGEKSVVGFRPVRVLSTWRHAGGAILFSVFPCSVFLSSLAISAFRVRSGQYCVVVSLKVAEPLSVIWAAVVRDDAVVVQRIEANGQARRNRIRRNAFGRPLLRASQGRWFVVIALYIASLIRGFHCGVAVHPPSEAAGIRWMSRQVSRVMRRTMGHSFGAARP